MKLKVVYVTFLGFVLGMFYLTVLVAQNRVKEAQTVSSQDWITNQKIRAGWIRQTDGIDKIWTFKDVGMNALAMDFGPTALDKASFKEWAREAKRAGIHLFAILR